MLSTAQKRLIANRPAYVYGAEVRTARSLERQGVLRLSDEGSPFPKGNPDRERWSVEWITKPEES